MQTTRVQVQLLDVDPPVLRVLDVPAASTLDEVHQLLQAGMGWTDSHLYWFDTGTARYGSPGLEDADVEPTDDVLLRTMPATFTYLYDLGDSWDHEVRVLGPGADRAGCSSAEGACPPEDCGGAPGYEHLCDVLADPAHPEHAELLEWTEPGSGGFDPRRVDLVAIDRRVRATAGEVPASVRLLLDLADGVKLTPGGRLPRVVVRAVHDQRPGWYDLGRPASIEDDLRPLVHLHALLRQVGLLRLRTGVLHTTKAARDDLAILRRLRSALPEGEFSSVLATAATALLVVHGPQEVGALARRLRPEIGPGWSSGGRALTAEDLRTELYRVLPLLVGLDQVVRDRHTWSAGPSARTLFPRVTMIATHKF